MGSFGRAGAGMNQPTGILIDTNVWLDAYIHTREGHPLARELLRYASENGIQLWYAMNSIRDVFYLTASSFKRDLRQQGIAVGEAEAAAAAQLGWSCINHMAKIACAVGSDLSDVWLATKLRSIHSDFEDNLVLSAATRANASCMISNDRQLLQHATVAALTPADWLALQKA